MTKKKVLEKNELKNVIKEKKDDIINKEVNVNGDLLIDAFISDYKITSGKANSYGAGFKRWYFINNESAAYSRKSKEDWINEFKRYMSSPVK